MSTPPPEEPASTVRGTVTGFVALGAATLFAQVLGFFVLAVISRRLGPDGVGAFAFAVNLAGYFAIPVNFGIVALAVRDIARDPANTRHVVGEVLVLQTVLAAVPYVLLVALAPVLAADADSERIIPIVGLAVIVDVYAMQWVLYARQRYVAVAIARAVGAVVFAVLVLVLLQQDDDPLELGWYHVLGGTATGLLTLGAVLNTTGRPDLRKHARTLVTRFRAGIPLGVAAVMISIYYTADHLMLGYLKDTATVGQYAVAYKLPLAIITFAGLWNSVIYPHFATVHQRSVKELREQLGFFTSLALVGSLPLVAGAIITGADLMPQLFGDQYGPAGTPFVVLSLAAALVLVTINWGAAQVAAGDEKQAAVAVTCGAAANIVLNFAAIPLWGMTGAASATLAAEAVVLAYSVHRMRKVVGGVPLDHDRIGRAAAATAIMIPVLLVLPDSLTAAGKVGVGAVVYLAAALALRVVRVGELRQLLPAR